MTHSVEMTLGVGAPRYPVLHAFMQSRAPVSAIIGPLGSGKTFGAAQRILEQMCEQEPNADGFRLTRWLAVRNTYPDLMGTTYKDFEVVFDGLGKMKMGGLEPPTFHVDRVYLEDGTRVKAEVIFLALDRDDAVRKLRGYQLTGVWLNEMKELVKPVVDMADLRHGRYPSIAAGGVRPTWHGMLGDMNAPDEDHWVYRLAEEDRPEGWEFYRQPGGLVKDDEEVWQPNALAENLENLPDDYYVRGQQGKDPDWIAVMLGNEYGFVIDGKPVHPEFVDSAHTAKEEIETIDAPLTLGIDFGRTPACAISQLDERFGRWNVIDEFCSKDMSAAIFGPELKMYLDRHYSGLPVDAWGDPAGSAGSQATEDTPILIMRSAGIPVRPCPSNQPDLRRAAIANPARRVCMDGKPALQVSPKAKLIRKGLMGGFCYRRLKIAGEDRYTDHPDKNQYSHPVEACEYGLMGGGEGREALISRVPRANRGKRQETAIL